MTTPAPRRSSSGTPTPMSPRGSPSSRMTRNAPASTPCGMSCPSSTTRTRIMTWWGSPTPRSSSEDAIRSAIKKGPREGPFFICLLDPRFDRVALPPGVGGDAVAAHDQGAWTDGGGGVDKRGGERHRVVTQGRTVGDGDGVEAHDAVLEQVRLHHSSGAHGGTTADITEVGFGEPVALDPCALTDVRAERLETQVEAAGAQIRDEEPGARDGFHEGILQLIEPHEPAEQRVVADHVSAHADTLDHHGHHHGQHTHGHENQNAEKPSEPCA